jgi:lysine-specific demethylase 8
MSLTGRSVDPGLFDKNAPELKGDVDYPTLIDKESLDEINVWIGRGITPLHFDGYDNLLAVVRGVKRILLLEPKWFENVYIDDFQWASVDIRNRDLKKFPRLAEVPEPIEFILNEGEMLYLPAHWLHQVDVPEGYAITLNYWYRSQQGAPSSGYSSYFYLTLKSMLKMYGDMNQVEQQDGLRRLRAVVDQLNEGRSPQSQKARTWSGGEGVFSRFRV